MPLDLKSTVFAQIFNGIMDGIANYNAAIGSTVITAQVCGPVLDFRTIGRQQAKVNGAPSDYPQIVLKHTGGNSPTTPTKTFALAAGIPGTDTVQKTFLTLEMSLIWDASNIDDASITALIAYIDGGLIPLKPKLGLCYGRDFTWRDTQKDEPFTAPGGGTIVRPVLRRVFTAELWPHTADFI